MINNQDYQLEEMENEAVSKSKNLRMAGIVGAAVVGAGGTAAYGASKLADQSNESPLTSDDLASAAEAGEVSEAAVVEEAPAVEPTVTEVHHHHYHPTPAPEPDPEISIDETAVVVDENGDVVVTYDAGTIDGKAFVAYDTDGNGYADTLAYDENGNGVIESNEVVSMDNESYRIGHGQELNAYYRDSSTGEMYNINDMMGDGMAYDDSEGIRNDYAYEKEHGDLAHNNPDYNNHDEAHDYNASMEPGMDIDYSEKYEGGDLADSYDADSYNDVDSYSDDAMDYDDGSAYMA